MENSKPPQVGASKDKRKNARTSVSLAPVVWDMACDLMTMDGYNRNFSAFIANLIRQEHDRKRLLIPTPEVRRALENMLSRTSMSDDSKRG